MPTQKLGCVRFSTILRESIALGVNGNKPVLCLRADNFLFPPKLLATNITLKRGPDKDQRRPCILDRED